jgi:hypothetical protein
MSHVPARLRRLVVSRASGRCEYCGLAQAGSVANIGEFLIESLVILIQ